MIDARHLRLITRGQERATAQRINQAWRDIAGRIHQEAAALTEQIAERYAANDPVPITWLYQRDRLTRLHRQTQREVTAIVPDLQDAVTGNVEWGRDLASLEAARLARDNRFANTIRRRDLATAVRLTDTGATRSILDELPTAVADRVEKAFIHAVALGQHPDKLAREISQATGYGRARAQTIARTELHRAVRETSLQEWRGMLDIVAGWIWSSSLDGRTCPVCVAMHGTEHPLDAGMDAHPNCFPAGTVVVPSGRVEAATSRPYRGELVTIRTASGDLLTGTPNHPVATSRGWVPLDLIKPGDQVFHSTRRQVPGATTRHPDDKGAPALIEQVAESLRSAGEVSSLRVPSAPEYFHGDGSHGDVDVVAAARLLGSRRDATLPQDPFEEQFMVGDTESPLLSGLCRAHALLVRGDAASGGSVGGSRDGAVPLGGSTRSGDRVLTETAKLDSRVYEYAMHHGSGYTDRDSYGDLGLSGFVQSDDSFDVDIEPSCGPDLVGGHPVALRVGAQHAAGDQFALESRVAESGDGFADRFASFPVDVALDRVVHFERRFGSLHVYNLQTSDGCYLANNIIVHNCRCVMVPIPRDASARRPLTPGPEQFEQWPEERQAQVVGPVRLHHIRRGDFTLTDLVRDTTHPVWGPGRTTASIQQATSHAQHRRTIRTAA